MKILILFENLIFIASLKNSSSSSKTSHLPGTSSECRGDTTVTVVTKTRHHPGVRRAGRVRAAGVLCGRWITYASRCSKQPSRFRARSPHSPVEAFAGLPSRVECDANAALQQQQPPQRMITTSKCRNVLRPGSTR